MSEERLDAVVEALRPDGEPYVLRVTVAPGSGSEMVEAAIRAARRLHVSRCERLREFEVREIGGALVVSLH